MDEIPAIAGLGLQDKIFATAPRPCHLSSRAVLAYAIMPCFLILGPMLIDLG